MRRLNRRYLRIKLPAGFRFLTLLLLLLFPIGKAAAADTVKLAIGYIPHIQFAPLYVGMEKGFYEEEGIELDIEYGFGIDIFSLLSVGRIDIGLSDSDQLILSGTKDLGLKAIMQYYQNYPVSIVTRRQTAGRVQELKGKRIGSPALFGTSYIGLLVFLEHFGLSGSVEIENIGYTQISSLLSGKVDAAVCFYNNEPIQMELEGVDIVQWPVKDISNLAGASFISTDKIIAQKTVVLERFVRATKKAIDYTFRNRKEAYRLSLKYIGPIEEGKERFIKEVLDATCELFVSPGGYGHIDPEQYRDSMAILRRLGLLERDYPVTRILHTFECGCGLID